MPDADESTLRLRLLELDRPDRTVTLAEVRGLIDQIDGAVGSITAKDVKAFRSIALRQIRLLELSPTSDSDRQRAEWEVVDSVFEEQFAKSLSPEARAEIDRLHNRKADLEQASLAIQSSLSESRRSAKPTKRSNWPAWLLMLAGVASLLFGWPWGALVGAILLLAGVIVWKSGPTVRATNPEQELQDAAQKVVDSFDIDAWVVTYEKAVNTDKVLDLNALNADVRSKRHWPAKGPVLGHEGATDEMNSVLMSIETQGGRVSVRQAIVMQAVLEPEGPEAFYLKERAKRGYPPLSD